MKLSMGGDLRYGLTAALRIVRRGLGLASKVTCVMIR